MCDLCHVFCDDVEAAPLLHNDTQQLHQVVVPQLPVQTHKRWKKNEFQSRTVLRVLTVFYLKQGKNDNRWILFGKKKKSGNEPGVWSYVMTEASAMKACAVASFLIHLTATLVPL